MNDWIALSVLTLCSASGLQEEPKAPPGVLGVSWPAWNADGYKDPSQQLSRIREAGFSLVTLVPTYTYAGLNRIDFSTAPHRSDQEEAMLLALREGISLVYKPHLDPPRYQPGFDPFTSDNHSWRANCSWRGFFDLDPLSEDYREGVVLAGLEMIASALDRLAQEAPDRSMPAIRLELGSELMNSVVYAPERWLSLLEQTRAAIERRGLSEKVLLSHNFSHHFLIAEDFVLRMSEVERQTLARYIAGLDALAVSQYMDLTAAMSRSDRQRRLPTASEVGAAFLQHDQLVEEILGDRLGLADEQIPDLHIGEFGVGRGGLQHPNLWEGDLTAEQRAPLLQEIARGHEGLLDYLSRNGKRRAESAVLWVTGPYFDVFGWMDPAWGNPAAVKAIESFLRP
jgi:hypothetical protein